MQDGEKLGGYLNWLPNFKKVKALTECILPDTGKMVNFKQFTKNFETGVG